MYWASKPLELIAAPRVIAERVRRSIHLGEYLPGDRLPTGRDLAQGLDVSRSTLREALSSLEREGYLSIRRGVSGGAFVADLRPLLTERAATLDDPLNDLASALDFWRVTFVAAAERASSHLRPADIHALQAVGLETAVSADPFVTRRAEIRFQLALTAASASRYLKRAVEDALVDAFVPLPPGDWPGDGTPSVQATRVSLIQALKGRDLARVTPAAQQYTGLLLDFVRTPVKVSLAGGRRRATGRA